MSAMNVPPDEAEYFAFMIISMTLYFGIGAILITGYGIGKLIYLIYKAIQKFKGGGANGRI